MMMSVVFSDSKLWYRKSNKEGNSSNEPMLAKNSNKQKKNMTNQACDLVKVNPSMAENGLTMRPAWPVHLIRLQYVVLAQD